MILAAGSQNRCSALRLRQRACSRTPGGKKSRQLMHALIQYWAASIALAPASERISWCQGCLSLTDSEGVCRSSALRHTFLGWQLWIQTLQAVTKPGTKSQAHAEPTSTQSCGAATVQKAGVGGAPSRTLASSSQESEDPGWRSSEQLRAAELQSPLSAVCIFRVKAPGALAKSGLRGEVVPPKARLVSCLRSASSPGRPGPSTVMAFMGSDAGTA